LAGSGDSDLAKTLSDRLKVYRAKKPYREIRATQQAERSSRRQR
jgi:hypothetical protein